MVLRRFGSADVLETLEVPKPTLTSHTVLIRVIATSVNPGDWQIRNGRFRFFIRPRLPCIPGADVAGVVEQVSPDVTHVHLGDAVYAMLPLAAGGYAEYAVANEAIVAPVPSGLSIPEAAVPLAALTALQALRDKAQLQRNAHLLINGASGGVGSFAIQIFMQKKGYSHVSSQTTRTHELAWFPLFCCVGRGITHTT